MRNTIAIIGMVALLTGCTVSKPTPLQGRAYPYVAPPERQAEIRNGMAKLTIGMTPADVEALMGKPDEVHELYDRIKNAKPVGYTWWFIIQRKADSGSVAEKAEKLVRVSFNLKDTVTRVDWWGMEDASHTYAGREFESLPLDVGKLAAFIGVTVYHFAFTPPEAKTKVGCVITEYAVVAEKPVRLGRIASVECEARVSATPKGNRVLILFRKDVDGRFRLRLTLNNYGTTKALDRDVFQGMVISTPMVVGELKVLCFETTDGTWSSSAPLKNCVRLVAIEFLYE